MGKTINLQLDDGIIEKSENILDEIGLDCQTFVKMCFKKLNKEQNLSFLMVTGTSTNKADISEQLFQQNAIEESINYPDRRTKKVITAQMRDYIWNIFKSQYNSDKNIDCSYLAKIANAKIGITQGSAYIYFLILDNLVTGVPNTRTMKFDDLVTYLNYINGQLPHTCIVNSVKSLTASVPYWEEHIQGYFAQKVSNLISQYK